MKGRKRMISCRLPERNAVKTIASHSSPRIDESIDSLGENKMFSALGANSGYWQIEVCKRDRGKTAFTLDHRLYLFMRMHFRLRNAPATFQHDMDVILRTVRREYALSYLEDIVIFSRTPKECVK